LLPSDWVYKLAGILMIDEYGTPRYQPERTHALRLELPFQRAGECPSREGRPGDRANAKVLRIIESQNTLHQ
jgi:hypothetical protein